MPDPYTGYFNQITSSDKAYWMGLIATAERVCRAYYWRKGQEEEDKAKAEEENQSDNNNET